MDADRMDESTGAMEEEEAEKGPEVPAEPPPPRVRKFGCGHMALCGLGLVLLAGGYWYTKLSFARRDFARHVEQLVDEAEAEVKAAHPEVPDEENAAPLYREAFPLYVSYKVKIAAYDSLYLPEELFKASQEEVDKYLKANEPYLAALRKAVAWPKCDFGLDLRSPEREVPECLRNMEVAVRFLSATARVKAREGKNEEAVDLLAMSLRVAGDVSRDRDLVSRAVKLECDWAIVVALESMLDDWDPDAAQVGKLQAVVGQACVERGTTAAALRAGKASYLRNYYGPLVSCKAAVRAPSHRASLAYLLAGDEDYEPNTSGKVLFWLWQRSGYVLGDAGRYEATMGRYAALADQPFPESFDAAERAWGESKKAAGWWALLSEPALGYVFSLLRGETRAEARLRLARLALGCRLYKLKFGAYPDKLSDLSAKLPEHFKTLPTDPFSSKTMLYKRTEQGCKVYSVGDNREDDGGVRILRRGAAGFAADEVFEIKR